MDENKKSLIQPYLTTRGLTPENQETPIHFLRQQIIPKQYFYIRNHFPYPSLTKDAFTLSISGEVEKPIKIHYDDIIKMPSRRVILPLECSGNKRSYFRPRTYGEQWEDGAISQGEWTGVSLSHLLSMAGVKKSAVEVMFEAYDFGKKPGYDKVFNFERSLPIPKALHDDTIVAYQFNREPITFKHGYPLRLIVPQWYAMASVKWLKSISVIPHKFQGPFQTDDYVYYPHKKSGANKRPVTTINVSSLIQHPLNYQILDRGTHNIDGIAWTGEGKILKIEVSTNEGKTWEEAKFHDEKIHPYSWVLWNYKWNVQKKGSYTIMSRAYDSSGRIQPFEAEWNRKGYGYNAVYTIKVKVE
jgi:sulfite oxidase